MRVPQGLWQRCSLLKAAGETGTLWMTEVCNAVVKDGKVPEDWSRSWMVNINKGEGDALTCCIPMSRDISLTESVFRRQLKTFLFRNAYGINLLV